MVAYLCRAFLYVWLLKRPFTSNRLQSGLTTSTVNSPNASRLFHQISASFLGWFRIQLIPSCDLTQLIFTLQGTPLASYIRLLPPHSADLSYRPFPPPYLQTFPIDLSHRPFPPPFQQTFPTGFLHKSKFKAFGSLPIAPLPEQPASQLYNIQYQVCNHCHHSLACFLGFGCRRYSHECNLFQVRGSRWFICLTQGCNEKNSSSPALTTIGMLHGSPAIATSSLRSIILALIPNGITQLKLKTVGCCWL